MTWQIKKLGEVLDYEQPGKYIVASKNYSNDYKTPVLTAGKTFILGNTKEKENIFPADKLPVIIFDDFTTATQFVDFPFKVKSSAMKILHPKKDKADAKYLFYLMQTIKVNHATHKRFWISEYSKIEISVPPIGEQRKIVARTEKLLAKIKEVKQLRAEAQEATKNLLSAELHKIFEEGKAKGWEEKSLGEVCKLNMGQSPVSSTYNQSRDGLPFYQGKKDYGEKYPIPRIWCSEPIKIVEDGDILISVRAPVGALNVAKEKSCIGRGLAGLRGEKELNQDFLFYFLKLKEKDIAELGTGSTFKAISKKNIENYKILLPEVSEQKKTVARLDALAEKIKKFQEYQNQTRADLIALEKSVLHQAFVN